jgi:hypothetical protein
MKKLQILFTLGLMAITFIGFAQSYLPAVYEFSSEKNSILTLKNGTVLEGTFVQVDHTNGIIKSISFKPGNGEKVQLKEEDILNMYVANTNTNYAEKARSIGKDNMKAWDKSSVDMKKISTGNTYFEQVEIDFRGKRRTMLLQLQASQDQGKVRIYADPWTNTPDGGAPSSYIVKAYNNPAYQVNRWKYAEDFNMIFGDCVPLIGKYKEEQRNWSDFHTHLKEFADCVNK